MKHGEVLAAVVKSWGDLPALKAVAGVAAVVFRFIAGGEITQNLWLALGCLLAVDTLTGVVAATVTGQAVSSEKLRRFFVKCIGYGSVILVARVNTVLVPGFSPAAAEAMLVGLLGAMIATESLSILENVRKFGIKLPAGLDKILAGRENGYR